MYQVDVTISKMESSEGDLDQLFNLSVYEGRRKGLPTDKLVTELKMCNAYLSEQLLHNIILAFANKKCHKGFDTPKSL